MACGVQSVSELVEKGEEKTFEELRENFISTH